MHVLVGTDKVLLYLSAIISLLVNKQIHVFKIALALIPWTKRGDDKYSICLEAMTVQLPVNKSGLQKLTY